MDPKGQVALITGGASGLGAATAQVLAAAGAKVALLDVNEKAAAENAAKLGGMAAACDVTNEASAIDAIAKVREKFGVARILVNCAGVGPAKRILGRDGPMPLADYRKVIEINLIGTFNMLRLAAADMSKADPLPGGDRGVIVSTASVAAFEGQVGPSRLFVVERRRRRVDTSGRARIRAIRHSRRRYRARNFRHTDADGAAARGAGQSGRVGAVSANGSARRANSASLCSSIIRNGYINGEVIRIDGALRMAPR